MKLEIIFVTYDGDNRKEEQWADILRERKMQLARELTGIFMNTAGFILAEDQEDRGSVIH